MTVLFVRPAPFRDTTLYEVTDGSQVFARCMTEGEAQELLTEALGASTQVIRGDVTVDTPGPRVGCFGLK